MKRRSSVKLFHPIGISVPTSFLAIILAIFATPISASSADKLIVTDPTGVNTVFAAGDNGTIRLNSNTLPSSSPPWALIYGSSNNNMTGYTLDSYESPVSPATYVAAGGGGAFRFARGTQSSPLSVGLADRLGFFVFSGYDGTNFLNTSGLTSRVDNAVSTGNVPAKLVFETIAQPNEDADDGIRVERMIISSNGYVAVGGSGAAGTGIPTPTHPFQVCNAQESCAYVTTGGVWTNASSRTYKENINALTVEEANQTLEGLNPIKYNYKADKEDKHVGFLAEDVPDLVATKDRKGLSPMDIVAVLTKVVKEQTNMISDLSKKVDAMQKEINRVKAMNIAGSVGSE